MPIITNCPCGQTYRLPDNASGKTAKCRSCGDRFVVEAFSDSVASNLYYVRREMRVSKAYDAKRLKAGVKNGKIVPSDEIASTAEGPWTPVSETDWLKDLFESGDDEYGLAPIRVKVKPQPSPMISRSVFKAKVATPACANCGAGLDGDLCLSCGFDNKIVKNVLAAQAEEDEETFSLQDLRELPWKKIGIYVLVFLICCFIPYIATGIQIVLLACSAIPVLLLCFSLSPIGLLAIWLPQTRSTINSQGFAMGLVVSVAGFVGMHLACVVLVLVLTGIAMIAEPVGGVYAFLEAQDSAR